MHWIHKLRWLISMYNIYWSFIRKISVMHEQNLVVCSKNQVTFMQLVRCTPQRWGFGSGWHLSDVPPGRDILWPSMILLLVRLTFGQIFGSGWPLVRCTPSPGRHLVAKSDTTLGQVDIWSNLWVTLTFGQMYPPGRDILWPSVILLWVRLTFAQTLGQVDCWSGVPPGRDMLWTSAILLQVRLIIGEMYPPAAEASGQVDSWLDFRSGWH